ncbi:uncharacterized protein LOC127135785 [Lathyrus oleraceus]|uniref:uncharacterized protein LOC127135785 n=1 Tax=Pisum sativum TaxID=3888 RepID=UPI0021D2FAC3|nr:uncharacterized protein LOC127135785 [Pisum sativum]
MRLAISDFEGDFEYESESEDDSESEVESNSEYESKSEDESEYEESEDDSEVEVESEDDSEVEVESKDDSEAKGKVVSEEDSSSEESGGNPISINEAFIGGTSEGITSKDIDSDSEDESEPENDSESESESEGEIDSEEEYDSNLDFNGDLDSGDLDSDGNSNSGGSPYSRNIPNSEGGHTFEVDTFGVPASDTVLESEDSEQVQRPQRIRNIPRRSGEFDMLHGTKITSKGEIFQCAMLVDSESVSTEEALKQKVWLKNMKEELELLKKFELINCKAAVTPADKNQKLDSDFDGDDVDATTFN